MRTSLPPAASRAVRSASAGDASRKWNVVPPSISIDGRVWWVSTKTGVWKGGLGPHAPFQSGSSCHPGWPNFPAPMISAPIPAPNSCRKASSTPPLPPGCHERVANIHSCSRSPAWPKCASALWPSPVPKPSSEIAKFWTRASEGGVVMAAACYASYPLGVYAPGLVSNPAMRVRSPAHATRFAGGGAAGVSLTLSGVTGRRRETA